MRTGLHVGANDGGACGSRYLVEGVVAVILLPPARLFVVPGETLDLVLPDRTMMTLSFLLLKGIVLEHVVPGVVYRWIGVSPTTMKTTDLGGRCSGDLTLVVARWTRAGWRRSLVFWWHRPQV